MTGGGKTKMKKSHIFTTIIISIFLASCQQPLNLLSTTGGASLSEIFNTDEKIEQRESPSQLNVSQGLYPDTIKIQWSKVNGATSYVLQRAIT